MPRERPIPDPHNEAIEQDGWSEYRILWQGFHVATTSYCEDPRVAKQFALVPDLIKALDALVNRVDTTIHAGYVGRDLIATCRAVLAKAEE